MAVLDLIDRIAARSLQAPAFLADNRSMLRYTRLAEEIRSIVSRLNFLGVGREDRVAVVLPNGPEMAVAFLTVASGATFAPLNPGYSGWGYAFYLSDLGPRP